MKHDTFYFTVMVFLSACNNPNANNESAQSETQKPQVKTTTERIAKQEFGIKANQDTVLVGQSGTIVLIDKNSFVDENGKPVQGDVQIEIKEALKTQDIIKANLTTTSNGKILQSGGMIYLNATSQGKNLKIANDASVIVSVPADTMQADMQIFSAEYDINGNINWVAPRELIEVEQATEGEVKPDNQPEMAIKQSKANEKGNASKSNIISPVVAEPVEPLFLKGNRKRLISITVGGIYKADQFGEFKDVSFKVDDNCPFDSTESSKFWTGVDLEKTSKLGKYRLKFYGIDGTGNITRTYAVTPVFKNESDYKNAVSAFNSQLKVYEKERVRIDKEAVETAKEYAKNVAAEMRQMKKQTRTLAKETKKQDRKRIVIKTPITQVSSTPKSDPAMRYYFELLKVGWANIDRFYHDPRNQEVELVSEVSNLQEFDEVYTNLYFKSENIYIQGFQKPNKTFGYSRGIGDPLVLPLGETAVLLARAYKDGKTYFSMQKFEVETQQTITLYLKESDEDEFLKQLVSII